MIKAILFDLDGVLVDACEWHYEGLNRALEEVAQIQIARDEHISTFNGLPTKRKLEILVEQGRLDPALVGQVSDLKQKHTIETIEDECRRSPKKEALLRMLRHDGFKIGCVTNCVRRTAELMLGRTGLWGYLNAFVHNEAVINPKPHPEGYWRAMADLQVLPEETLIVEDSPKGIAAGKASGADVLEVSGPDEVTWLNIARRLLEDEK